MPDQHSYDAEIGTCYLGRALNPDARRDCIANATELAKSILTKRAASCVVVTGWSGALVGIPIADRLGLPITMVRKVTDYREGGCHSGYALEGYVKRYASALFVDDCVSSGRTLRYVVESLSERAIKVAGVLLYAQTCNSMVRGICERSVFRNPIYIERYDMAGAHEEES